MLLLLIFATGALVRFLVPSILPHITDALASTVETSTPVDSFRSLQEAFYLINNNLDVYDGGIVHQPPLLVAVLNFLNDICPHRYLALNLLYTIVDLGIAWKLARINAWYNEHNLRRTGIKHVGFSASFIAAAYLLNPLMVLTNWSHSTSCLTYFLIVESIAQIVLEQNSFRAVISLAVATYISLTPAYLLIPLIALAHVVLPERDWTRTIVHNVSIFFISLSALVLISFILTGLFDFFYQCYGTVLFFKKIAPNLGLWWYIFTEMFDFFTPLYKGIFNLYGFIFILPITIRYFEHSQEPKTGDSFLAVVMCYLWISFSKSYPIIGDLGLAISFLPIFKNTVIPHVKFMVINVLTLMICLLLSPIFYYCWIVLGNGNSNFFYSMSLIWGAVHIIIFLDFLWGRLVYDYTLVNEVDDVKTLRLTQI